MLKIEVAGNQLLEDERDFHQGSRHVVHLYGPIIGIVQSKCLNEIIEQDHQFIIILHDLRLVLRLCIQQNLRWLGRSSLMIRKGQLDQIGLTTTFQ